MEDKKVRQEMIKKFDKKIKDIEDLDYAKDIIKDNKIQFIINKINYRVRKPTFKEKQLLRIFKAKKRNEFIQDSNLKLREELILEHKKSGIDIEAMDEQIRVLEKHKKEARLKQAQVKDADKPKLTEKIEEIRSKQIEISLKKQSLLENSIEDLWVEYVNAYLVYLVLEIEENNKWKKVFNTFEELENSDNDELLLTAGTYLSALIYHE